MKFLVVQGSRKIEVDTSQPVAGDETQPNASAVTLVWTLGVLKQYVEQQFKVPRDCMKLLHKGKSLTGDELTLEQLKVKDGDKIMVLAGQAQPKPNWMKPSKRWPPSIRTRCRASNIRPAVCDST